MTVVLRLLVVDRAAEAGVRSSTGAGRRSAGQSEAASVR